MALQTKKIYHGTTTTLHTKASTAVVANNAMSAESAELNSGNHGDNPMGEFELDVTFSVAPAADKSIDVYIRDQEIAGTNKSPAPSTTFKRRYLGSFYPDAVTTQQYLKLDAPIPKEATFYLFNNATGQSMPATDWGLKVRPFGWGS